MRVGFLLRYPVGALSNYRYEAAMKDRSPLLTAIEKTSFQVSAHVRSRLLGRDIETELDRLYTQPKRQSYVEAVCISGALFAFALVSASFGLWGLLAYFAIILLVFR